MGIISKFPSGGVKVPKDGEGCLYFTDKTKEPIDIYDYAFAAPELHWAKEYTQTVSVVRVASNGQIFAFNYDSYIHVLDAAGAHIKSLGGYGAVYDAAVDKTAGAIYFSYDTETALYEIVIRAYKYEEEEDEHVFTGLNYVIRGIATDEGGYIYVADDGGYGRKLSADGVRVWNYNPYSSDYPPHTVAVDSEKSVFLGYSSGAIHKLNYNGDNIGFSSDSPHDVKNLVIDKDDNVIYGNTNGEVGKLSNLLEPIWKYTNHEGAVNEVAVDAEGTVISACADGTVHRISSSGENIWVSDSHIIAGDTTTTDCSVYTVAVDDEGDVYSGGKTKQVHKIDKYKCIKCYY